MNFFRHIWDIRHAELYYTGTTIRLSLFRYILTALVIPSFVWINLNERILTVTEANEELSSNLVSLKTTNTKLEQEVMDLKRRLARALTIDSPTAKR